MNLNNFITALGLALMLGLWLGGFWEPPPIYIDSAQVRHAREHMEHTERLAIEQRIRRDMGEPPIFGPGGTPWGAGGYAASQQNVYADRR